MLNISFHFLHANILYLVYLPKDVENVVWL